MRRAKMQPCPTCGNGHHLFVYRHDEGTRRVECDKCGYAGPRCTSIKAAIKHHDLLSAEMRTTPPAEGGPR
jgi:hypothetical protein